MKQLRELFARNSSRWLAIELILVTCACMWAFDPVIVTAYVTHQPMGYDPDQLVRMEVGCTKTMAEWFNNGNYQNVSEQELLLEKIRAMDDVQQAYPANGGTIGFDASVGNGFFYNGGDSLLADKYKGEVEEGILNGFKYDSNKQEWTYYVDGDTDIPAVAVPNGEIAQLLRGVVFHRPAVRKIRLRNPVILAEHTLQIASERTGGQHHRPRIKAVQRFFFDRIKRQRRQQPVV